MGESEEEKARFNKLCDDVEYIKENQRSINKVLRGPKYSSEPDGLIYHVSENTKFRKFATKVLWLMLGISISLLAKEVLTIITNN